MTVPKHKLSEVISFGEQLIETGDLDPVYIALVGSELSKDQLHRLLLAYFCFYHLGVAAFISEQEGDIFWEVMEIAARNKFCDPSEVDSSLKFDRWPRGSERRHFRGDKCVDAVQMFRKIYVKPERLIESAQALVDGPQIGLNELVVYILDSWPMCGAWLSFKAADIFERVLGMPVLFPNDILTFYAEPRAALDLMEGNPAAAAEKLLLHFRSRPAPPVGAMRRRNCNIQEIESICCKWKSSLSGHYYVGKDIHEVRHALKGWGKTADKLLRNMPVELHQGLFE